MPNETLLLDDVFKALANPTRRQVVAQLGRGPAPMSELAIGHDMASPSFLQHLQVLEQSGIIVSVKRGRIRTYTLNEQNLRQAENWLSEQRNHWNARLDQLDDFLKQDK